QSPSVPTPPPRMSSGTSSTASRALTPSSSNPLSPITYRSSPTPPATSPPTPSARSYANSNTQTSTSSPCTSSPPSATNSSKNSQPSASHASPRWNRAASILGDDGATAGRAMTARRLTSIGAAEPQSKAT